MSKSATSRDRRPFRILSLDGGGIRGAFTAAFAAEIERHLGVPLADYFDLIAGTSTGAIIAAALALREPAEKIERFYRERGPEIFKRRTPAPVPAWKSPSFGLLTSCCAGGALITTAWCNRNMRRRS